MPEPDFDSSFMRQILYSLSSYSVAGKIVVITGNLQGIDLIVAHVCVWANVSHIILVGPQECALMTASARLQVTVDGCGTSTRIHARMAAITDIDQIASVFFSVRQNIGIPDLLILCTPSRCSSRLMHEYTIEDAVRHLDLNDESKKGFISNFLMPGTRKRKILIDLSIIADEHLPKSSLSGPESQLHRYFLAYVLKLEREWVFTFHDILHGFVTTKRLGEKLNRRNQAWVFADSMYLFAATMQRLMKSNSGPCLSARALAPARKDRLNIRWHGT